MRTYEAADQRALNAAYLDILNNAIKRGRAVRIEVKSIATKTNSQLAYYWGVVVPAIQKAMLEDGNEMSQEEVNQFLNTKFFYTVKRISWRKGKNECAMSIYTPRSKSGATKDEMMQFLDKCIRWASMDLQIHIPSPEELGRVPE